MGYINIQEIPTFTGYSLGQMLNDTISEYFANPVHQKEFEKWKQDRERNQGGEINGSERDK